MGLTPIEDRSDRDESTSRGQENPGVRQRLRSVVSGLLRGISSLLGGSETDTSPPDGAESRRPAQQGDSPEAEAALPARTNDLGRAGSELDRSPERLPTRRREFQLEAQIRGDTLYVYDPDCQEAYISSEAYERVER